MRRPVPFDRRRLKRRRTIRSSPGRRTAYGLPVCVVLGLFALTLFREGVMDGHPPRRQRIGGGGMLTKMQASPRTRDAPVEQKGWKRAGDAAAKPRSGGNEWIPQSDVIKYNQFKAEGKEKEGGDDTSSEDGGFVGSNVLRGVQNATDVAKAAGRYVPSLNRYPLTMLREVTDPVDDTDIPFLWHIPKAAGSTVKNILSKCFHLSRPERRRYPESLEVINGFVNVDVSTIPGIARAKDMGLVPSGTADAIVTSYLHEGAALFTEERKGRLFTIMRHPVHTSVSLFYYLGYATWERFYKEEFANMTLEEYARSPFLMENWMTRYLTREETRELTEKHVELATEILAEKCVVGLIDHLDETMSRLQRYFGWGVLEDFPDCLDYYLHQHKVNVHKHKKVEEGSQEWNLLAERNKFDVRVYENALALFEQQAHTIPSRAKHVKKG